MFNRKQRPGHLLICSCTFKLASRCLLLLRCCAREANSVDCGTKRWELCRSLSSGSTCIVFPPKHLQVHRRLWQPHALRSIMQLVPRGDPQSFLGSSPLPQHCSCVESVSTNYHQHSPAHVFQRLMCYLVLHCESTASVRIWQDMASQPGRIRFWSRSSKRVLLCQVSWRKWSSLWTCLSWDLLLGGWAIPVLLTPNVQPSAPLSHREIERGTHLQLHHTAPFRICDEDFPRSNRWSNTQDLVTNFCGNFLHLKYAEPAGHEGPVSNQLRHAAVLKFGQVSTGHGGSKQKNPHVPTLAYAGFDKPLPLWPLQKKGFEAVLLSLTYSYSVRKVNKSNGLTGCSNI